MSEVKLSITVQSPIVTLLPTCQCVECVSCFRAPFLSDLKTLGHTVVTILRTDQYEGLESFTNVGTFVPLERDRHGQLVREFAPAFFALPLPDQKGQCLPLRVALIRDLRRHVPSPKPDEETEEEARNP